MTRGIAPDLSGRTFGQLLVLHRNGSDAQNNALWSCRCSCGNVVSIRAPFLLKRQRFCSKRCPEYAKENRIDITSKRFGKLVAVSFVEASPRSQKAIWKFLCDCGNSIDLLHDNVIEGHTASCGCIRVGNRIKYAQRLGESASKLKEHARKRRWHAKHRAPKWLTEEHWEQIDALYIEALRLTLETGISHDVDHIYPLHGRTAWGLHVPWNLRILPHRDNLRKLNRLPEDVCLSAGNK